MSTTTTTHRSTTDHPTAATRPPAATTPGATDRRTRSPVQVWLRLYRHHLRLLRNGAIAWIVALTGISVGVVATFEDRYTTPEELALFADMEGIPAFEAMLGRLVGLTTVEGATLSRWGMFSVMAAVWGMLAGARLLRRAEERGHLEKLRAGVVSPRGLTLSAIAALLTTHLVFAVALGAAHAAAGMDTATSWALGCAMGLLTAIFALAGALASQLVPSYRRAVGIVGAVLGLLLGLRVLAAASASPEWLWWTTPFGWVTYLHPLDEAWATVFTALGVLLVVLFVAVVWFSQRDLHAGLLGGATDEPVRTPRPIGGHVSLAVRLTRAGARTWGAIVGIVALAFGLLARDFAEAVADLPTMIEMGNQLGWVALDTPEGIVAFIFGIVVLLLALFAAGQAAAIREEEASWRIEHLLVRPLGRTRWLLTRVATAAAAVVLLAVVASLAAWAGTAIVGTPIDAGDALLAVVNVVPLAWLVLGLGVALLGLVPRLTAPLAYGLVLAAYLLDFVGGVLELPESVLDASPFRQLAAVPAEPLAAGPLVAMLAIGAALAAVGVVAFRRRDLQEA
jgi:ABC-2 type transport system permease protein